MSDAPMKDAALVSGWIEQMSHPERLLATAMTRSGYRWCVSRGWAFLRKDHLVAIPQAPLLDGLNADYGFQRLDDPQRVLCVELDGHAFHERTQQQAAEDRRRDRVLLRSGVPTMRFMALEVMRDAGMCVLEIERFILRDPCLKAGEQMLDVFRNAPTVEMP